MTQQATNDPHLNWSCNYSSCSSDKYPVSAIRCYSCLVAILKQQAKQKCCPYLVHLAMITVQITREQLHEERSQRTTCMTILLWAWGWRTAPRNLQAFTMFQKHSGLFFCHITHCRFRKIYSHCMFGSKEHFSGEDDLKWRQSLTCTLHCIFWLNLLPGNLNCSFPFLYWEASFWYCAMLWVNLCPGK